MRTRPAAILVACWLIAGCYSYEDRWGRDPAELKRNAPRNQTGAIEIAKSEAMQEEEQRATDDLAPVAVLFVNGDPLTVEDVLKWIRYDLEQMAAGIEAVYHHALRL